MKDYKPFESIAKSFESNENPDRKEEFLNIMAGAYAYGHDRVDELLERAAKRGKCLVFYYETEEDLRNDVLSYKFERISYFNDGMDGKTP